MKLTLESFLNWCHGTARDRKNQRWVLLWSSLWMASWVVLIAAIRKEWIAGVGSVGLATAATLLPAILLLFAYRRFLLEADELRRKIELDALAFAFGVGLVGGFSFFALALAEVVEWNDFLYVIAAMVATHSLGIWVGHRRYS